MSRTRLTKRRLEAIRFALDHMLAGDVDETLRASGGITSDDLDRAMDWVVETQLTRGVDVQERPAHNQDERDAESWATERERTGEIDHEECIAYLASRKPEWMRK